MKKILLIFGIIMFSLPAIAVCSITGEACTAPLNFEPSTLKDKLVPNQNIQKTDAFKPVKPLGSPIHTSQPIKSTPESSNYDADCQFGNCLPGVQNPQAQQ